jgi:hypothetical protein
MKWLPACVVAATIATTGCDYCGPEQHAITTSANTLTMGGGVATRQIQYVTYRLTEPPATPAVFDFVFNTLEGSTNGEGVALTFTGTDALTQEVVTIVLALPVALREGDQYAVGSTFSVEVGTALRRDFGERTTSRRQIRRTWHSSYRRTRFRRRCTRQTSARFRRPAPFES